MCNSVGPLFTGHLVRPLMHVQTFLWTSAFNTGHAEFWQTSGNFIILIIQWRELQSERINRHLKIQICCKIWRFT